MLTKEILDSHPLKTLKSEISKQNIKGYSTMKRPELTALMLEHKDKFDHIKHAEKKEKKAKAKAPAKPKDTHAMPDGSKMTGAKHSSKSVKIPKNIADKISKATTKKELDEIKKQYGTAKSKPVKKKKAKK